MLRNPPLTHAPALFSVQQSGARAQIERSAFRGNAVIGLTSQGGAIAAYGSSLLSLTSCVVESNTVAELAQIAQKTTSTALGESAVISSFAGDDQPQARATRKPTPVSCPASSRLLTHPARAAPLPPRHPFPQAGGGVYAFDSAVRLAATLLIGNSASRGGAVYISGSGSSLNATNVTYTRNAAGSGLGGAVSAEDATAVLLADSVFDQNVAARGGAVFADSVSSVTMVGMVATGNR